MSLNCRAMYSAARSSSGLPSARPFRSSEARNLMWPSSRSASIGASAAVAVMPASRIAATSRIVLTVRILPSDPERRFQLDALAGVERRHSCFADPGRCQPGGDDGDAVARAEFTAEHRQYAEGSSGGAEDRL